LFCKKLAVSAAHQISYDRRQIEGMERGTSALNGLDAA
jgi:hypothetical protein